MIVLSKIIPLSLLSIGIFLLMQVLMPIVSFQVWSFGQRYNNLTLISPNNVGQAVLGISVQNRNNFSEFVSDLKRGGTLPYQEFSLTVPKLNIMQEPVFVDSNDLSKGLAHLPGSTLPGEKGNVFISGHSSLPLFSLKKAFFVNLTDLKIGDEIRVEAAGATFRYKVSQLKVVDPKDLSVINPPDSMGRYISLMTCVPPGLTLKRLVVLGKMI